jgi:hypothetical protein
MTTQERTCIECGEDWPADTEFFHRHPRSTDGLTGQCKACRSAYDSGRNGTATLRKRGQLTKGLASLLTRMIQKPEHASPINQ